MKKQTLKNSYNIKRSISSAGMRGIAQSFVNIGIPTVVESSVEEKYSYFKRQGRKDILYSLTDEIKVRL